MEDYSINISVNNFKYSLFVPPPVDGVCVIWKESASLLQRRSRLKMLIDDGRTMDGRRIQLNGDTSAYKGLRNKVTNLIEIAKKKTCQSKIEEGKSDP